MKDYIERWEQVFSKLAQITQVFCKSELVGTGILLDREAQIF
jgi:hypothetical protein